jgi:hypothetical protein
VNRTLCRTRVYELLTREELQIGANVITGA